MKQLFLIVSTVLCVSLVIRIDAQSAQPQSITITNKIKSSDLKKFGQMPHFTIHVDGKKVDPGGTLIVPAENEKLVVRYEYSFLKGVYRGANDVTFKLNHASTTEYDLTFSWKKEHEPWRVMVSGATAIDKKKAS